MKINIFNIKIKKKLKKENFQLKSNFYWKIVLCIMFLMILGSFIFGFFLSMKTNREAVLLNEDISRQTDMARKERIEKVLEYFSEREKKSADILNPSSSIVDPSL